MLLYNAVFKEPSYCQAAVPGARDEWKAHQIFPSIDPFGPCPPAENWDEPWIFFTLLTSPNGASASQLKCYQLGSIRWKPAHTPALKLMETHTYTSSIYIQIVRKRIWVVRKNIMSLTCQEWFRNMICISLILISRNISYILQTKEKKNQTNDSKISWNQMSVWLAEHGLLSLFGYGEAASPCAPYWASKLVLKAFQQRASGEDVAVLEYGRAWVLVSSSRRHKPSYKLLIVRAERLMRFTSCQGVTLCSTARLFLSHLDDWQGFVRAHLTSQQIVTVAK